MNNYNDFSGGGQSTPIAAGSLLATPNIYPQANSVFPAEKYTDILVEIENLILASGLAMGPDRDQILQSVRIVAAAAGGIRETITTDNHTIEEGRIYYVENASVTNQTNFTIPASFPLYGAFHIRGKTVGGWKITPAVGQFLYDADTTFTSVSPAESNNQYDTAHVECIVVDSQFQIISKNTV